MPRSRSPLKSLAATLDRSGVLVAVFDEQRRLIYASAACDQWLGVAAEELLGRTAFYSSQPQDDPRDTALASLSPPPDAFQGATSESLLVGPTTPRRARFWPLPVEANQWAVLLIADNVPPETAAATPRTASSDWHAALAELRSQLPMSLQSEYLAGDHPLTRRLREQIQAAARSKTRTVVVGPRGSGAAEIATTIHVLGGGRKEGIVPIHCPLQDAETLQAAIRAVSRKVGRSSAPPHAQSPAVLLLDVPLLPRTAQQELLGFLQLPGFEVRMLATSRVPLAALVRKEKFSSHLAALLTTLELRVPPLKDRAEDVPLLAQLFVERFNLQGSRQLRGFVPEAIEQLVAYGWPENVEELGQAVAQTCERSAGPWILASELPERLRGNWQDLAHPRRVAEAIDLDAFLADAEKFQLARALQQSKGNKAEAARLLGISRPRLLRRLVQLDLAEKDDIIDFQPLGGEASPEAT